MYLFRTLFSLSLLVLLTASFITISDIEVTEEAYDINRSEIIHLWETSGLEYTDISLNAFQHALTGYHKIASNSKEELGKHLTIVDFSLPSDRERLVVYNIEFNSIAYTSLVAHGRNSGEEMATSFSNRVRSYQSSLGFFLTGETYDGKHGYSLRLDGLETGINDNARERAVVIHGADYATPEFIAEHGRLGRSFGCPSLPPQMSAEIIDYIKEKQVLFIYADKEEYLSSSEILN